VTRLTPFQLFCPEYHYTLEIFPVHFADKRTRFDFHSVLRVLKNGKATENRRLSIFSFFTL